MPERVVNYLEAVQIHDQYTSRRTRFAKLLERLGQPAAEHCPVRQTGQRVHIRKSQDFCLAGCNAFQHVIEVCRQCANFVAASQLQPVGIVAIARSLGKSRQFGERLGDATGEHDAAEDESGDAGRRQ